MSETNGTSEPALKNPLNGNNSVDEDEDLFVSTYEVYFFSCADFTKLTLFCLESSRKIDR